MRAFAIYDEDLERKDEIGFLLYYDRTESFIIELRDDLTEWTAPLLYSSLVKKGIYTIPKDFSKLWVDDRVIPSGRQNIGEILKNAKLSAYSEGKLLFLSQARSSQDACYIKEIDKNNLPDWVLERQNSNIDECFPLDDERIIVLLFNDKALEVDLKKCLEAVPKLSTIIGKERVINTIKVDVGGYGVVFNDSVLISKSILIDNGVVLPIYANVFHKFIEHSVINTTEACERLGCTRQNLSYWVKNESLSPLKPGWKENVFLKGEVDRLD